jgi:hypothetical protein
MIGDMTTTLLSSATFTDLGYTYSHENQMVYRMVESYSNGYALAVEVGALDEICDDVHADLHADDRARCAVAC